jgi:hypothetical protein
LSRKKQKKTISSDFGQSRSNLLKLFQKFVYSKNSLTTQLAAKKCLLLTRYIFL